MNTNQITNRITSFLTLLCVLIVFPHCGGTTAGIFGNNAPTQGGNGPAGSSSVGNNPGINVGNNAAPSNTGIDGNENGVAGPQASIPAPTLIRPNQVCVLAYNPDYNSNSPDLPYSVPLIGTECAVPEGVSPSAYVIAVSATPFEESTAVNLAPTNSVRQAIRNFFLRDAHAQAAGANSIVQDYCDALVQNGGRCCTLQPNGAFDDCYLEFQDASAANVYLTYVGPPQDPPVAPTYITEAINPNLLWFKNAPRSLAAVTGIGGGNAIAAVSSNVGIAIDELQRLHVTGDRNNDYRDFDAPNATQVAWDSGTTFAALLLPTTGIQIAETSFSQRANTTLTPIQVPQTRTYTALKFTNGRLIFGREPNISQATGNFYAVNSANSMVTPRQFSNFFAPYTYAIETIGNVNLAIYTNQTNQIFISGCNELANPNQPYSCSPAINIGSTSNRNIKYDIQVINSSRALILDALNNRVGLIDYSLTNNNFNVQIRQWLNLGNGKNPVALVRDMPSTNAYILNAGDSTISKIDLSNSNTLTLLSTYAIQTAELANKNIGLALQDMTYVNGQLVVADTSLRGAMLIPTNKIQTTTVLPRQPRIPLTPVQSNSGIRLN